MNEERGALVAALVSGFAFLSFWVAASLIILVGGEPFFGSNESEFDDVQRGLCFLGLHVLLVLSAMLAYRDPEYPLTTYTEIEESERQKNNADYDKRMKDWIRKERKYKKGWLSIGVQLRRQAKSMKEEEKGQQATLTTQERLQIAGGQVQNLAEIEKKRIIRTGLAVAYLRAMDQERPMIQEEKVPSLAMTQEEKDLNARFTADTFRGRCNDLFRAPEVCGEVSSAIAAKEWSTPWEMFVERYTQIFNDPRPDKPVHSSKKGRLLPDLFVRLVNIILIYFVAVLSIEKRIGAVVGLLVLSPVVLVSEWFQRWCRKVDPVEPSVDHEEPVSLVDDIFDD